MLSPTSDYGVEMLIAIGTAGMLVLTAAIVLFVAFYQKKMIQQQLKQKMLESEYQQRILDATLDSQESERKRLAGDLHDSIGGMLSAIRVGLSALARQLPEPAGMDPQKQMLDDTIESVRKLSHQLMPATLEKFGFAPAVRELCERMQSTSRVQISFVEMGDHAPVDPKRQLMIYRIVQELLNNALKHSQATFIEVVARHEGKMHLIVEDNGIGIDPEQMGKSERRGLGLFNIQSRVMSLGAELSLDQQKTEGSRIVIIIPYESKT